MEVYDFTNLGQTISHTYQQGTVNCETTVTLNAENTCNTAVIHPPACGAKPREANGAPLRVASPFCRPASVYGWMISGSGGMTGFVLSFR